MIPESPVDAVDPQGLIARLKRHTSPLAPIPTEQQPRLWRLPHIRALLFDVYGTLFISASGDIGTSDIEAHGRALGQVMEALKITVDHNTAVRAATTLVQAIIRTHEQLKDQGRTYPEVDIRTIFLEVLGYLRSKGVVLEESSRQFCEILAVEYECRINPTWPMPGLADTLQCLRERGNLLGIVSNAQFYTPLLFPAHLDQTLESLGFDPDLCVWSYRHLEAKPSPNLFRRALEALQRRGIEPAQVLYVGNDRINDVWPAAQSGMRTALFAGDRRSFRPRREDLRGRDMREDVVLTEFSQLLEVLDAD
ncbi:MAG: HAD family hydrolase [Spirochaetaceae bacterium]|nr:MAG: HAD family hydrolase [Spirochaetaceae bacterium]